MSQRSFCTTSSVFLPISDDGDGESSTQPTTPSTTRLDKEVECVKRLQANALVLKKASSTVDEVLEVLNGIVFNGKIRSIATLKSLQTTLATVSSNIERDAAALSPIPSMSYAFNRSKRAVSPDTLEVLNDNTNKRQQLNRSAKLPPNKRFKDGDDVFEYPPPANETYSPTEVVNIVTSVVNSTPKCIKRKLIQDMIERKLVVAAERTIYTLLHNTERGVEIPESFYIRSNIRREKLLQLKGHTNRSIEVPMVGNSMGDSLHGSGSTTRT